jgi:hypothetical protein
MRLPRRFRARVGLAAGAPMPPGTSAEALEAKVRELRGAAE